MASDILNIPQQDEMPMMGADQGLPPDEAFIAADDPEENSHEEIETIVKAIVDEIDTQERPSREIMLRLWKYLDLLWHGITNYYWNSQLAQYRPITYDDLKGLENDLDFDPSLIDKTINLIRPYGESMIGVLTTTLPKVKFFPANADKVEDIRTAKVSSEIEKRIVDDNFMRIKIIQMLVNLWNGGFVAAYNHSHTAPEYGSITEEVTEDRQFETTNYSCPNCEAPITSEEREIADQAQDAEIGLDEAINFSPDEVQPEIELEATTCPQCGVMAPPNKNVSQETKPIVTGSKEIPKKRQIIDIYGPLNVKIPVKATKKDEVIWLILEQEMHESQAKSLYPEFADEIVGGESAANLSMDRYARSQYELMGELGLKYTTMRWVWMRPSAYWIIGDKERVDLLKAQYPKGLVAVFSGEDFLFCDDSELLDEHWTLSFNPLYNRVYGDPLGKALVPLQEVANEIYQLEVETFRHSIPQLWADPKVVDFEAYKQSSAKPGQMYPLKSSGLDRPVGEHFFESRSATIPKEVTELDAKQERLFQFISGVLPPVFGGPASGSKTLGEYEQAKNQALQRLSIPWLVVNVLYAECMSKAVKCYRDDLLEDEFIVESKGDGSFVNTWIRKADAQSGEVGKVSPEIGEQFPASWAQKAAKLMELIGLNNEMVNSALFHPENAHNLSMYLGLDDFYIPGDEQRNKQLNEIAQMITAAQEMEKQLQFAQSQGMQIDPTQIQPQPLPIDPTLDDSAIHSMIAKAYLCSNKGEELKEQLPLAYGAIVLHIQEHDALLAQQQAMAEQKAAAMAAANSPQPKGEFD